MAGTWAIALNHFNLASRRKKELHGETTGGSSESSNKENRVVRAAEDEEAENRGSVLG